VARLPHFELLGVYYCVVPLCPIAAFGANLRVAS